MSRTNAAFENGEGRYIPSELDRLSQSLETRKAKMLVCLESLSHEERGSKPAPSDWSPLQVMEHVVIVEEWMAAPQPVGDNILLKGHLFMIFGVGLMRTGLRVPTLPMATPRGDPDYADVKRRWEDARNALASKRAAVTGKARHLPIALHPAAGPLNAKQALTLLSSHAKEMRYLSPTCANIS